MSPVKPLEKNQVFVIVMMILRKTSPKYLIQKRIIAKHVTHILENYRLNVAFEAAGWPTRKPSKHLFRRHCKPSPPRQLSNPPRPTTSQVRGHPAAPGYGNPQNSPMEADALLPPRLDKH